MLCKFFMHNWAHIRVILEAKGLLECPVLRKEMAAHYIHGIHGQKTYIKPSTSQVREERQEQSCESSMRATTMPVLGQRLRFSLPRSIALRSTKILPIVN